MRAPARLTSLAQILIERIQKHGPITFADYMEACLYDPQHGYYANNDQQPRRDYFTSVDVSPVFGRLVARQFAEMWMQLGRPAPFMLLEAGGGDGTLAKQVLDFVAEACPEFYSAIRYLAIERSDARRRAQSEILGEHIASGKCASGAEMPEQIGCGCIFSNELLDAMPVHRVVQAQDEMREIYVTADEDGFRETLGAPSSGGIGEFFAEQGISLRDGQQAEAGLVGCDWIESAGRRLQRGFVVTIDYGREGRELYDERHMRGTVLAYDRHRATEGFYRAPGEQDLTAHVNFTALELWGGRGGLTRTGVATQTNFLLALSRASNFADIEIAGASEKDKVRAHLLFKTLIYPEGMGETFQVLVQQKGIEAPKLTGLQDL
jgi:SAM-dependent MidA family methyltransferase